MKATAVIAALLAVLTLPVFSQSLFMTKSGQISFYSHTPMEDIEAVNNEVTSIVDTGTGEIVFAVLVKSFRFEKALMEEHFNENYMESSKWPKSTFRGKVTNLTSINFAADGTYNVSVEGDLTVHGVQHRVTALGTAVVSKGKVIMTAQFIVNPSDYNIEIPSLVKDKIGKSIEVKMNCQYEPKS